MKTNAILRTAAFAAAKFALCIGRNTLVVSLLQGRMVPLALAFVPVLALLSGFHARTELNKQLKKLPCGPGMQHTFEAKPRVEGCESRATRAVWDNQEVIFFTLRHWDYGICSCCHVRATAAVVRLKRVGEGAKNITGQRALTLF